MLNLSQLTNWKTQSSGWNFIFNCSWCLPLYNFCCNCFSFISEIYDLLSFTHLKPPFCALKVCFSTALNATSVFSLLINFYYTTQKSLFFFFSLSSFFFYFSIFFLLFRSVCRAYKSVWWCICCCMQNNKNLKIYNMQFAIVGSMKCVRHCMLITLH